MLAELQTLECSNIMNNMCLLTHLMPLPKHDLISSSSSRSFNVMSVWFRSESHEYSSSYTWLFQMVISNKANLYTVNISKSTNATRFFALRKFSFLEPSLIQSLQRVWYSLCNARQVMFVEAPISFEPYSMFIAIFDHKRPESLNSIYSITEKTYTAYSEI
jgi:hypothetical protein